jgi:hypothetical protein
MLDELVRVEVALKVKLGLVSHMLPTPNRRTLLVL